MQWHHFGNTQNMKTTLNTDILLKALDLQLLNIISEDLKKIKKAKAA